MGMIRVNNTWYWAPSNPLKTTNKQYNGIILSKPLKFSLNTVIYFSHTTFLALINILKFTKNLHLSWLSIERLNLGCNFDFKNIYIHKHTCICKEIHVNETNISLVKLIAVIEDYIIYGKKMTDLIKHQLAPIITVKLLI